HDCVTIELISRDNMDVTDEIHRYLNARYVSASEASWRIFHYRLHNEKPDIQRLQIHLPDQQIVTFSDDQPLQSVLQQDNIRKTMLTEWFTANATHLDARELTYGNFPTKWVWNKKKRLWTPRKRDDILIQACHDINNYTLELSNEDLQNKALYHLQSILCQNGKNLTNFPHMPTPTINPIAFCDNYLIQEELQYDMLTFARQANSNKSQLNSDQLATNIRLLQNAKAPDATAQQDFANWLLQLGEGCILMVNKGENIIKLPMDIVLPSQNIQDLINFVYTDLAALYTVIILTICADSLCEKADNNQVHLYPIEFLNSVNMGNLPAHKLFFKVGTPIMLMRNLNAVE
ncbi:16572_t:CDS:2, partial [Acaulospora morrowiae]